ncbi:cupin [Haladaptatus pallidirubidus]|uniref:cupin n=1 Tax=Haladaptatus pallidirubidus TaxID=1008152 RepID=UPI0035E70129
MKKVAIDVDNPDKTDSDETDIDHHKLSEPLGTTDLALNYYRLAPGEALPGGLHAHGDQEEVFVVIEGKATFETYVPHDPNHETGEITVEAGETIRFAPSEFQSGKNDSESELMILALGAPRDSEDVRFPLTCPDCDHDETRLETDAGEPTLVCPDCGAERAPKGCPDCDHDELRVALEEGDEPAVRCPDCGSEFENPPLGS